MKKFITLLLAVLLISSITLGCTAQTTTITSATTKATTTATTASATTAAATTATATSSAKLSGSIEWVNNRTDLVGTTLKDAADAFMKANPGTNIVMEALANATTVIQTRMAANMLPDITPVKINISKDFPTYFEPLNSLGFTEQNLYFYKNGLGPDNNLYYVYSSVNYYAIVYNKAVFASCGITSTPKTMDEFYAACEKMKAKGITPVGTNFKDAWPLTYYPKYYPLEMIGDAEYLNNLSKTDTLLGDEKGGMLEGIKWLKTLVDKGYTEKDLMSTNWDGFKRDMAQGKFGMAYIGTWLAAQIVAAGGKQEDLGVFPLPESKSVYIDGDWNYGISKNSANKELAKAFFKYLFYDGVFAEKCAVASPIIGGKITDPYIKELMTYNPKITAGVVATDDFNAVYNKMQLSYSDLAQKYVTASDPGAIVKDYNDRWAAARKAAGVVK